MTESAAEVAKSIRLLAIAVWAVALVLGGQLLLSAVPWVFPEFYVERFSYESGFAVSTDRQPQVELEAAPESESASQTAKRGFSYSEMTQFYELSIDEKIERASMIAVADFVEAEDGLQRAIISEILKKDAGIEAYYDVGDEHSSSSFYPREGYKSGDGIVLFFTGSPAVMTFGSTYSGDRISGLGDIPLKLFREKCEE